MDKVTVICLCHNHAAYVEEALQSVVAQTHPNIQLIIIDDASTDNSRERIELFMESNESFAAERIYLTENVGNCKAFNIGLKKATGDYVIDLAADDVLLPHRIAEGVAHLQESKTAAASFCNVELMNEQGHFLSHHFPIDHKGRAKQLVPQGDLYQILVANYLIDSTGLLFRKQVLLELGGYDENLSYEDFDILVRIAREHPLVYQDQVLIKKRILKQSMSAAQYAKQSRMLPSTYLICKKIHAMNRSKAEHRALKIRLLYEAKQALLSGNFGVGVKLVGLLFAAWPPRRR